MPCETVIIGADERATRALLTAVPDPARVALLQLGPLDRDALAALPVERIVHAPDVDAHRVPAIELASLVARHSPPAGLIVLDSSQWSRDLAGCLAAQRDATVVWAIDRVADDGDACLAHRIVLGGSHRLVHRVDVAAGLTVVLAKPVDADERRAVEAPAVTVVPPPAAVGDVRELESRERVGSAVALPRAKVVVCVGRGIGGPEHVELFQRLVARLGGALGATRAVVDQGWLPFAHQIGQTGETVAPDLYLGFGVSGAAQHLAGMREAKRIVAINTDPDAPLCRLADIVIEGSAVEVCSRLLTVVEQAGGVSELRKEAAIDA